MALLIVILVAATLAIVIHQRKGSPALHTKRSATRNAPPTPPPAVRKSSITSMNTSTVALPAAWAVRQATIDIYDPARMSPARGTNPAHAGRALHTTLRWPVSPDGQVAPGRMPLFVFAHGFNVSAASYSAMLDNITRNGIVVAAPDFPGESTAYPGPATESDLASEPCDIEYIAKSLEQHPPIALQSALRHAPLVVGGHSDGATAAAAAGYASACSTMPIRAVVALSSNDVTMTGAYRFGKPPVLLAITGTADEINPMANTLALYEHVPAPAWLVTIEGGTHLGTFTTDADLPRVDAIISDFVLMAANGSTSARRRLTQAQGGRVHLIFR